MSKLKLISAAQNNQKNLLEDSKFIVESLQKMNVLVESVTHVLANIAAKAAGGQQLNAMSINSTAAFMAGVEALAQRMVDEPGPQVQNVLRLFKNVSILPDGTVTTSAAPVAEHGKKFPDLYRKYKQLLDTYAMSLQRGKPAGEQLTRIAKALQQHVDNAARTAMAAQQPQTRPAQRQGADQRQSLDFT